MAEELNPMSIAVPMHASMQHAKILLDVERYPITKLQVERRATRGRDLRITTRFTWLYSSMMITLWQLINRLVNN